jgi:hypothetical protein
VGSFVSVEGVALNTWAAFGDSTVHISGAGAAIRGVRVRSSPLTVGSRVRLLGTIQHQAGQPIIANATPALLGSGPAPLAETVTATVAGSADGARLDAQLVRVNAATISDTLTVGGDFRLSVTDASGSLPLTVLLDREGGFDFSMFTPMRILDVTGLLLPLPDENRWILKPRQASDVVFR